MSEQAFDAAQYARALERFAAVAAREEQRGVSAAGRSRLLHHGGPARRAFVLLHGLTAVPAQFAMLAPALHATGANVFVPRLPRHGHGDRMSPALAQLTAAELVAAARDAVETARGLGAHLTVAGFSTGGLMGAWIAQHLEIDRAICIAPLLALARVPLLLRGPLARGALLAPNAFLWWHPRERIEHGAPHGYPRFATHAVAHALRLGDEVLAAARAAAPATRDIVLVCNAAETTVSNRAIAMLAAAWRARPGATVAIRTLEGLPASHDILEPLRPGSLASQVQPDLLAILTAP